MESADDLQLTPPEIKLAAREIVDNLGPTKSRAVYHWAYERFVKWCEERTVKHYTESVLLAYFAHLVTSAKMKSSTLWSNYSMIKCMLNIKHGVDISQFTKLRAYLKKRGEGYRAKKSKVFSKSDFDKFMSEADDFIYLLHKVRYANKYETCHNENI